MFKKYQKIHFVGIGGIGMSGIAEILLTLGLTITGSDLKKSAVTMRLARRGAKIWSGHDRKNVEGAHVVVVSSAVSESNPEVREARKLGIPVVPRAEMLAELMRLKYGIAVAGTHGKTTTTSLIAQVFDKAGLDPTMIVGGKVKSLRGNARLGKGEFLVAEADESDRSFLKLSPTIGVITNIDPEHMENYRDFEHLKDAFVDFANKVPFYGSVVCCTDHPVVKKIAAKIVRRVVTYGEENADYVAKGIVQIKDHLSFDVICHGHMLGRVNLPMAGRHHAKNALAAIAVARELDLPFNTIKTALEEFRGIARRFEVLHNSGPARLAPACLAGMAGRSRGHKARVAGGPIVVDDYGHHPVEIAATLSAAREGWPKHRLIVVVQPHRYTRLSALFDEFVGALKSADSILVMEVYPAGEKPIKGATGARLCEAIRGQYPKKFVTLTETPEKVISTLKTWCGEQDLVLFLGAGDITKVAHAFAKGL